MGGGKRIVKVTSTLVPFMGGLYVLVSLIVIVMNFGLLPQVLGRIFSRPLTSRPSSAVWPAPA